MVLLRSPRLDRKETVKMEADFSGWATRAGLKCTDGRTIMPGAFKHQDQTTVPLVWQHGHKDPTNVLGHAILENRDGGVYAHCFFNHSEKASHAKESVAHKDITMLSIWANQLVERAGNVLHGAIREVSLVLSGANPGALIENVSIRHSDGSEDFVEDEAIIFTGLEIQHGDGETENAEDNTNETNEDEENDDNVEHADGGETIADIYNSMSDKQKNVLHYMIGQALEGSDGNIAQDNLDDNNTSDKDGDMTRNVFEKGDGKTGTQSPVLSHSDVQEIVASAAKNGSLKAAVEDYALSHGIDNMDVLFPEATQLQSTPEFLKRRTEWVSGVLDGCHKSPFAKVKTAYADITMDEARAKGYIKGEMKKEEFFRVAKREVGPKTIYKKQKFDRDDIIDITDFDLVSWVKGEMRLMLDEEIARAILIGDGREVDDEDKIDEDKIIPIASDHELYSITVNVNIDDASSSVQEIVDAIVMNRQYYKGSGQPTLYTTEYYISRFLLLKDTLGRRIYDSLDQLASELRVSAIVPVEVLEDEADIVAIIVNLNDYNIGANKGGQVSLFDDFDIDYNQYKYLIETRISGALTRLKSAMVVRKVASTAVLVTPTAPTYDADAGTITITNTTGVVYKNSANVVVNAAGSPYTLTAGHSETITATPASAAYYFSSSEVDNWTFENRNPS